MATVLAGSGTSLTFMTQFGPLLAALTVVAGGLVTLAVTTRRENQHRHTLAVDEYRREQRSAIAEIAISAHEFRRNATAVIGLEQDVVTSGDEPASRRLQAAEDSAAHVLNKLTVARLLVHDAPLQAGLDALWGAWSTSATHADALIDSAHRRDPGEMRAAATRLNDSWPAFDSAAANLHDLGLERLAPLVVSPDS